MGKTLHGLTRGTVFESKMGKIQIEIGTERDVTDVKGLHSNFDGDFDPPVGKDSAIGHRRGEIAKCDHPVV